MCLTVLDIPEDLNPRIATEDIPCYKLLQLVTGVPETFYYITPWQNFHIDFGYKNRCYMAVDEMTGYYYAESKDFIKSILIPSYCDRHLYVDENLKWINGKRIQNIPKIKDVIFKQLKIYAGIHAYLNTNIFIGCNQVLFKAIIPKGSHYFIGRDNDIVADKMIIFDKSVQ